MRATQTALALLAQWFGPLLARPSLTITEIPDGWGSQASLVGGIIQTESAFRDAGHLGELYHELSHLWNARDLDNPSPRWNEGLARFVEALLRERVDRTKRADDTRRTFDRVKQFVATDSAASRRRHRRTSSSAANVSSRAPIVTTSRQTQSPPRVAESLRTAAVVPHRAGR